MTVQSFGRSPGAYFPVDYSFTPTLKHQNITPSSVSRHIPLITCMAVSIPVLVAGFPWGSLLRGRCYRSWADLGHPACSSVPHTHPAVSLSGRNRFGWSHAVAEPSALPPPSAGSDQTSGATRSARCHLAVCWLSFRVFELSPLNFCARCVSQRYVRFRVRWCHSACHPFGANHTET